MLTAMLIIVALIIVSAWLLMTIVDTCFPAVHLEFEDSVIFVVCTSLLLFLKEIYYY
jgi:hypothetical protein